jgi:hypothetical protein
VGGFNASCHDDPLTLGGPPWGGDCDGGGGESKSDLLAAEFQTLPDGAAFVLFRDWVPTAFSACIGNGGNSPEWRLGGCWVPPKPEEFLCGRADIDGARVLVGLRPTAQSGRGGSGCLEDDDVYVRLDEDDDVDDD